MESKPNSTPKTSGSATPPPPATRADAEQLQIQDLSVREQSGQTVLLVKLTKPISQYRHFPLLQPARIVLDIIGDARTPADLETFRVGTRLVGTVRFSSAQGSLRLTADLVPSTPPVYTVTAENNGLRIVIGSDDAKVPGTQERALVLGGKRMDNVIGQARLALGDSVLSASSSAGNIPDEKKYTGQKLSFDFKDADIKNMFRLLAEISGLNIVVTADVNRKVTLRLVEVPWDQALDLLITTNGLGKEQIGNVVRISTAGTLKVERDAVAAARKSEENLESLQTVYFNVNYAKVKDLEAKVKTVLSKRPDASLVVDERTNSIMIRDVKQAVEDAGALVAKLDTRTAQVQIESNLIETTPTFSRALGTEIDFVYQRLIASSRFLAGTPFEGAPNTVAPPFPVPNTGFRMGIAAANMNAFITAAEKEGNVRIISRPSVVTLNNIESTIESANIIRIRLPSATVGEAGGIREIRAGIILTVTPQVSADGFVLLKIKVKSSTLDFGRTVDNIPQENTREAIANVLVRDGETVVIGGIMKDLSATSDTGVPYLRDIPVLGWLFKKATWQKDFEELVVFITPRILAGGSENIPTAEQLWREQLKQTSGLVGTTGTQNP